MLKLTLAAASALALAVPAYAADPATLKCISDTVDPGARAQLAKDVETNLKNAGGQQSFTPSVVQAIKTAGETCKAKHGWSEAATQAAVLYSVPTLVWSTVESSARAGGIDPAKIEKRFMALPLAERRTAIENPDIFRKVADQAVGAGEINENNAMLAGGVLGMLAVRERGLADFRDN